MAEIRTGPDAAKTMASWKTYAVRLCLQAVSRAFQRGTPTRVSQINPLVEASNARRHWEITPRKYQHKGESNAPLGGLIHLGNGDGHVFLSLGGGKAVSTDYPTKGKVSVAKINDILRHFSGNKLLGWSSWINGRAVKGISTVSPSQTSERTAQVKKIAAYVNRHAKNMGLDTTTANSDGVPGGNYWKLIQGLGRTWGFYSGAIDGIPGPLTYKAEDHIWNTYVNKPIPAPEPKPVEPVPDETPEPIDVIEDGDGDDDGSDIPEEEELLDNEDDIPEAEIEWGDPEQAIIPDAVAKGLWVFFGVVAVSADPVFNFASMAGWVSLESANAISSTIVSWTGALASVLGLSRYAKTK